jgi:hypothetical protein
VKPFPFVRHAAGMDEEGWAHFAATCLEDPRLKPFIISLVITLECPPSGLLTKTLQNMDNAAGLVITHCARNEVTEEIIGQLLLHQNADIASAAALGAWQADPYGKSPDTLYVKWCAAIMGSKSDDIWLSEILNGDSSLSFKWLQRRLSDKPLELYRLEKAVDAAIDALNIDDRWNILHQLALEYPPHHLVERLVRDDLDLYRAMLSDVGLKHLHFLPLAGEPQGSWIDNF